MADNLLIDRRTSALLVMDFQTLIVDNYAAGAEVLLDRTAKLIAVARTAGKRHRPGRGSCSARSLCAKLGQTRFTEREFDAHPSTRPVLRRAFNPFRSIRMHR